VVGETAVGKTTALRKYLQRPSLRVVPTVAIEYYAGGV